MTRKKGFELFSMPHLPERLLLGPGPSPVEPRVTRAMSAPPLSHLDPAMMSMLDAVRDRLAKLFRAGDGAFTFAVSGTGTSGMETAIANLTRPGVRAVVVVTGYFGDRLAQILTRFGANVARLDVEWGRACTAEQLESFLRTMPGPPEIVAMVHAETSTGVLNPVADLCRVAADTGAMTIVDCVTSLGAHPVDVAAWGADAVYSCTQKGLGAPSGLAPITFSKRAREAAREVGDARRESRSFYFDLALLEDYWVNRKYHHTISAPLVYALDEALEIVFAEGLEDRWNRHRTNHLALVDALAHLGMELLPAPAERLWSLNAVKIPEGVDDAATRRQLLERFGIEIGSGLGPLAGRIWRVGLMGHGSSKENVETLTAALGSLLSPQIGSRRVYQ
jgi:alanine-glyoxylate transaminase/serine-glyoxylate transaminase/serine-pyruvate transaminase